jgi:transposase
MPRPFVRRARRGCDDRAYPGDGHQPPGTRIVKLAVVTEASAPGAHISEITRRHDLVPAQVFKWRRLAELGVIGIPGVSELPSFVAVEITKEPAPLPVPMSVPAEIETVPRQRRQRKKSGLIEIELGGGRRIRVDRDVDAAALDRVQEVLSRR